MFQAVLNGGWSTTNQGGGQGKDGSGGCLALERIQGTNIVRQGISGGGGMKISCLAVTVDSCSTYYTE